MAKNHGINGSHTATQPNDLRRSKAKHAIEFAKQAEMLGQYRPHQENDRASGTQAVLAHFITAQDPIIQTENGGRLPAVPLDEALKLNRLKDELEGKDSRQNMPAKFSTRKGLDGTTHGIRPPDGLEQTESSKPDAPLGRAIPPTRTNPLFPPLPMYGPPSAMRIAQAFLFRISSAILSFLFLLVIILGAFFTSIPEVFKRVYFSVALGDSAKKRPFYEEEKQRAKLRRDAEDDWTKRRKNALDNQNAKVGTDEEFIPTEGGTDPLVCSVPYYAARVGLACETFEVQTEDGFIIDLWHVYNPLTSRPKSSAEHLPHSPDVFTCDSSTNGLPTGETLRKYPVLLIHGLLQSSGAYCCTDDNSLAFYLAKSGLDVWLGNNRCGFNPRHTMLESADPRMWNWNIRQMGVLDLPALISRVLTETGFEKLALIAHSQGTTQTLVALAKEQRPEIGDKISVVCLLAPAAYAGPLIDKIYLKFMRVIGHSMFRVIFGIHAFIPFMMTMHSTLPGRFYGFMGYRVFSFLFNWTDERWDRGLRDRCFQFAPVYVSAESMRWWLGRECFAKQRCILSTKAEIRMEDQEDAEADARLQERDEESPNTPSDNGNSSEDYGGFAWYDEHVPPFAIWVAGDDDLVDGKRLLRRFQRGREPHVRVVHEKIIPGYEHLDVIWAIDMIEQVGREVLESIWKTLPQQYRGKVGVPKECEKIEFLEDLKGAKGKQSA
jgi:pimeloyl-ACP methyl ester carboxylesterase